MTVISGELIVLLPEAKEWQSFTQGMAFTVAANARFSLQVAADTAYLCTYE